MAISRRWHGGRLTGGWVTLRPSPVAACTTRVTACKYFAALGGAGEQALRFRKLLLLLPAVLLAACSTPRTAPTIVQNPQSSGYASGIDMPTDASDVLGQLQGRPGLQFVARYYRDPSSRWPSLSPAEAQRLSSLGYKDRYGLGEWHSSSPDYFTYASGYSDALSSIRQAKIVGQPPGSAIYFAVDFNARDAALYQVDQYFRGVNAGLAAAGGGRSEYRVGVYGSGAVCEAIRGAGLAQYTWLTGSTAWDGTVGYAGWNIRQAEQGGRFPGLPFDHDANDARNDYGGFQLANYANTATPAGAVVTAAAAVPATAAAVVSGVIAAAVPRAAPSTPVPPAPSIAPPAPAATTALAAATGPTPTTASTAPSAAPTPPVTPRPSTAAAEVAALTAAEPATTAAALPAARAASQPVVELPEKPRSWGSRLSEHMAAREEQTHERLAVHLAKEKAGSKREVEHVAANGRAVAVPLRHAGGSPLARSHEPEHPEHKVSTPRRLEDRGAHPQVGKSKAVRVLDQPTRRNGEQRHPVRSHHAADT